MTVSSGIAMDVHYCMGKEAGTDFFAGENKKCGKCGMQDKKGCCHDEHKLYKLGTDHKTVSADINFGIAEQDLPPVFSPFNHFLPASLAVEKPADNSPPHYSQSNICIRNCCFRI